MTKEEKLARKQQRKAEKVGFGKLLLWNSSSCSVALSTLMLGYATFYCTDVLQLAPCNLVRRTEKGRLRRRGWGLRWEKAQKGGKGTNLRGFFED